MENLKRAAPLAREAGITLLIEMLNAWESPRYFLDRLEIGLDIVREVGEANVRFQYDCYHVQRMEGQLIDGMVRNLAWIGHVQIADVPGRHEPGTGEIHYANVLAALDKAGYDGVRGARVPALDQDGRLARLAAAGGPGPPVAAGPRARTTAHARPAALGARLASVPIRSAFRYFYDHDGFFLAAGLSFYVVICISRSSSW